MSSMFLNVINVAECYIDVAKLDQDCVAADHEVVMNNASGEAEGSGQRTVQASHLWEVKGLLVSPDFAQPNCRTKR
jgi:hypothetical protein